MSAAIAQLSRNAILPTISREMKFRRRLTNSLVGQAELVAKAWDNAFQRAERAFLLLIARF